MNVSVLSFYYQKYTIMQVLTQKTTISEQKIVQSALEEKNRLFTIRFNYRIHKLQDCGQSSSQCYGLFAHRSQCFLKLLEDA